MNPVLFRFLIPAVIGIVLYTHSYILHMFEKMEFGVLNILVMLIPVLIVFEIDRYVTRRFQKVNVHTQGVFKLAVLPFVISLGISLIVVFGLYIPRKLYEINTVSNDTISIYHITSVAIQVLIIVVMANTIHQIRFLVKKWNEASLKSMQLEKAHIQTKLSVLQDQISPHFLFNNLNTLYGLIDNKPNDAKRYLKTLSTLYRELLSNTTEEVIYLSKELEHLEGYVYLLRTRFEDTIKIKIDLDDTVMDYFVPPFSLQMLIENAIKHNKFDNTSPLLVTISNEGTKLIVENNRSPLNFPEEPSGIGLKNISSRYRLLSDLDINVTKSEAFFRVTIPLLQINHETK